MSTVPTDSYKWVNDFFAPGGSGGAGSAEEMSGYLQIGSKRWPDNDTVGVGQFAMRLEQALGVWHSAAHTINIDRPEYSTHKFLAMWDTEKVPLSSYTGENCATGSLITVNMKGVGSAANANFAQKAMVSCYFDAILEIRDTGAQVMT